MSSSPVREAPSATAGNSHPESGTAVPPLSARARRSMLVCVFLALLFDGVELGLMPIASLSVSKSLLGDAFTPALGGDWFARFTAALMLGAAIGGSCWGVLATASVARPAWGSAFCFTRCSPGRGVGQRRRSRCWPPGFSWDWAWEACGRTAWHSSASVGRGRIVRWCQG